MKFFDSFWKASFYKEGKATSFWRSFGKVSFITFIVSIFYAICFYTTFGIHIPTYLYSYGVRALSGYPSELLVTIDGNSLSKNIEGELHMYTIPEGKIGDMKMEEVLPGYLIAINDKESASLDAYHRANALILLAKDGIAVQGDGEIQIHSYGELLQSNEKIVVSKAMVSDMVAAVNTHAESVPWVIFFAIIVLFSLLAPLGYLLLSLFNGLIIMWFSGSIIKKKITFAQSYIYGMYALAPVIVISEVLHTVPYVRSVVDVIPFFATISVCFFLWYMFRDTAKPKKEEKKTEKVEKTKEIKKSVSKKSTTRKKVKAID